MAESRRLFAQPTVPAYPAHAFIAVAGLAYATYEKIYGGFCMCRGSSSCHGTKGLSA